MNTPMKFCVHNSYKTYDNALKAFKKVFENVKDAECLQYTIIKLDEYNSVDPKHFDRFIPVCIGHSWIPLGAHFKFHVIG